LTFIRDQLVLWNGAECRVTLMRDAGGIALERLSDGWSIITTADILAGHQPQPPAPSRKMPRASLLGDA
jgi:hypothetical protein